MHSASWRCRAWSNLLQDAAAGTESMQASLTKLESLRRTQSWTEDCYGASGTGTSLTSALTMSQTFGTCMPASWHRGCTACLRMRMARPGCSLLVAAPSPFASDLAACECGP